MEEYTSKATITSIKATSRSAIKIKDNYYTVEFTEERTVPDVEDVDLDKERRFLFDDVNTIVDEQVIDIVKTFQR